MEKRKTRADGIKREFWNSMFTDVQAIHKRLQNWSLPVKNRVSSGSLYDSTPPEANDLEKLQLLISYYQTEQQRKYTRWFIVLTIVNIFVLVASIVITIMLKG